jgi:uncharacterized protein
MHDYHLYLNYSYRTQASIRLTAYGDTCLEVNNIMIEEPIIAFRDTYFVWKIKSFKDINVDSLSAVTAYFPTVELLFIGTGNAATRRLSADVLAGLKKKGIVVEVASTFNVSRFICLSY